MNHGSAGEALRWSSDVNAWLPGRDDRNIHIWDAKKRPRATNLFRAGVDSRPDFCARWQTLAVGTEGHGVHLVDLATGATNRPCARGAGGPRAQIQSRRSETATSNASFGGYGADNRVWSLDAEEGSLDVSPRRDAVCFAFSSDSGQLALADQLGIIRLWDLDRRSESNAFPRTLVVSTGCNGCRMGGFSPWCRRAMRIWGPAVPG